MRLEIISGELFATPPSTPMHQFILGKLGSTGMRVIDATGIGIPFVAPLDVRLANDKVVQPDILVLLKDRRDMKVDWGIDGPPSLLAEIVSDFTEWRDRRLKRSLYAWYTIPEYRIVEPENESNIVLSAPRDGEYRSETTFNDTAISATIPGLSVDTNDLFAPPWWRDADRAGNRFDQGANA